MKHFVFVYFVFQTYGLYQSVTTRSREFCSFLDGTGTGKNWSQKKEPVPVPENVLWCTFFEKVHI